MRFNSTYAILLLIFIFMGGATNILAQDPTTEATNTQGGWSLMEVVDGDTLYVMSLRQVLITGHRTFKNTEERTKYYLYKRCAKVAYPYALEALKVYEELQEETQDMSKRKKRKHMRRTQKEMKEDFEDKLKNLTRTQGYILVEMIERQTGKSFYDITKETRGGATAVYWSTLSKVYGYDLKDPYIVGKDALLDEVLIEYDFGEAIYKY
jgi:Domain of unknown function (DUF4294)